MLALVLLSFPLPGVSAAGETCDDGPTTIPMASSWFEASSPRIIGPYDVPMLVRWTANMSVSPPAGGGASAAAVVYADGATWDEVRRQADRAVTGAAYTINDDYQRQTFVPAGVTIGGSTITSSGATVEARFIEVRPFCVNVPGPEGPQGAEGPQGPPGPPGDCTEGCSLYFEGWFNGTFRQEAEFENVTAGNVTLQSAAQIETAADQWIPILVWGGLLLFALWLQAWLPAVAALLILGNEVLPEPVFGFAAAVMLMAICWTVHAVAVNGMVPTSWRKSA